MAQNGPNQPDESPYFDPNVARYAPDLTASRSAPHTGANAVQPTMPTRQHPPVTSRPRPGFNNGGNAVNRQQSSIGLRRLRTRPSRTEMNAAVTGPQQDREKAQAGGQGEGNRNRDGRRRSSSEPQRPTWITPPAQEGTFTNQLSAVPETYENVPDQRRHSFIPGRNRFWLPRLPGRQQPEQQPQLQPQPTPQEAEYDSRIVDFLDVIDPEVSTLTSITNLQNSLFIPSLGRFVNRRPTYDLSFTPQPVPDANHQSLGNITEEPQQTPQEGRQGSLGRSYSITSDLQESHYAVLPHGASLEGWSQEDIDRLNDHVRHMLHSRRSKFKRGLKAFGRYVRRPLGFFVTLYATLITLFGLAWVLFLIGWISIGSKQYYIINIIDYVLVALFAIVGDGLAPFRAVDTYHMIYIAHYHRMSWKIRQKLLLPELRDHNDLPTEPVLPDLEAAHDTASLPSLEPGEEFSVLTPQQQELLVHHQTKYAKSHTFYRPHETETHHAFPLRLLITITVLLDLHSCLQISLGACTWGIPSDSRPFALTTVILCCSITTNATAGLLIWIGDRRTRKKDVIERMSRQELTEEAMHKVQKDNQKQAEKEAEKATRRSSSEEGNGEGGWRGSLSLPRLSKDLRSKHTEKTGERSATSPKGPLMNEPPNVPAP